MKIANVNGRAALIIGEQSTDVADIATASGGRFGPDPMSVYEHWEAFTAWASTGAYGPSGGDAESVTALDHATLQCPVPRPRQVLGIGLNYRSHAEESNAKLPTVPATFTKFPSSLAGPYDDIQIAGAAIDWEVELVVIIGCQADNVPVADAWSYVAGLSVGQDISDRQLQFAAGAQFSLGKSRRGYGPIGPWVVTPDELTDPDNLALTCKVGDEMVQDARTNDLIFNVPQLIAELSGILSLLPGDVIFTGTPSGVGAARKPPRFLRVGDVIESSIEGIGTIRNTCVEVATR